jgi:FkbM family methyltransferase
MNKALKYIYNIFPFKKELFLFLKKIWTPENRIYRHLHFKGVFKIDLDKLKSFKIKHYGYQIENDFFWVGPTNGFEKESIKLWIKLCEDSDIILDIGANTGIYSLIAKTINPNAKVYAFEPVKRVFAKLKENVALNSFDIISSEKAVSNADGFAVFYDPGTEHVYSVTVNKNLSHESIHVVETKIETITLDSFTRQNNLPKIDLIKIDVESHEPEVLEGFSEYLNLFKPTMLIEILEDSVGEKINNLVAGSGYLYYNINEAGSIHQVERITKSDSYNYLLCSPETAAKIGLEFTAY